MSTLRKSDLPTLHSIRAALRGMMDAANRLKEQENDLGMLVAYATVLDDLRGQFDSVGRQLSKLELRKIAAH